MAVAGNPNPNIIGAQIVTGEDGDTYVEVINSGPQRTVALFPVKKRGTVVLNGATPVVVAYPGMKITDVILFSLNTVGGSQGAQPYADSVTAGTGFNVVGTAGDTSTYNWIAI